MTMNSAASAIALSFRRGLAVAMILLLPIVAAGGCASDPAEGYSARSIYPETVQTVAVPIFENATFVRDVEFELTDALIKEIERRTPYKVSSRARADSILSGRIVRVDLDQISKSRLSGLGEEVIIAVTIDFEWKDLRTNQRLVERRAFTAGSLFVPSRPTGERIELGQFSVVQELAGDIVNEMQAGW
jgi:hypothetical protein